MRQPDLPDVPPYPVYGPMTREQTLDWMTDHLVECAEVIGRWFREEVNGDPEPRPETPDIKHLLRQGLRDSLDQELPC